MFTLTVEKAQRRRLCFPTRIAPDETEAARCRQMAPGAFFGLRFGNPARRAAKKLVERPASGTGITAVRIRIRAARDSRHDAVTDAQVVQ